MRILWAVLCQDVITSDNDHVSGIFNPLTTYNFEGKPARTQTPYAIPGSRIHAVLMCHNDGDLQRDFSISVGFLPPTGSQIASGGEYFHGLQIDPGGLKVFHLSLEPLYYEVDGLYRVMFNAYTGGEQLHDFTTIIYINATD